MEYSVGVGKQKKQCKVCGSNEKVNSTLISKNGLFCDFEE